MAARCARRRTVVWELGAFCHLCHKNFTVLRRRHHCRLCGWSVCSACSPGNVRRARACVTCCLSGGIGPPPGSAYRDYRDGDRGHRFKSESAATCLGAPAPPSPQLRPFHRSRSLPSPVVLAGSTGVGKTDLCSVIVRGAPIASPIATMGCGFDAKEVDVGGKSVRVELWDTAGIARFRDMVAAHFLGATCVMLVYDVSDRRTFEAAVGGWLSDARRVAPSSAAVVLVGNKADRGGPRRAVSTEEAAQFAERHGFGFVEVSTLDVAGVEAWFHHVVTELCRCADSGVSFAVGGQPEQTAVPAAEAPLGACAAVVAGADQEAGPPPPAAAAACAATTAGAGGGGGGGGDDDSKSDGDSDSSSSSDEE